MENRKTIRFIGDVHGKIGLYRTLLSIEPKPDTTIQVGDMGAGFVPLVEDPTNRHRFIRGNHDSPALCKAHPNWIEDGTVEGKMMFIGGALSIDRDMRTEGVDWWSDEELSISELSQIIDKYEATRPEVMVTHDFPESVVPHMFHWYSKEARFQSRTRQAFDTMFQIHKPNMWIGGHWHFNADKTILGTRFICLNELSFIDIIFPLDT